MPPLGENIGRAYIRILADGDGLDESIRDEFDQAEPSVREAGQEHGRTYGEAFDKEVGKSFKGNFAKTRAEMIRETNESLTRSLSRLELADRFFDDAKNPKWREFRRRMQDEFHDAGALAARRMEQAFRDSGNLEGIAAYVESNIGPAVRRAQADLLREQQRLVNAAHAEALEMERGWHIEALRMNKDFDRRRLADFQAMIDNQEKDYELHIARLADLDRQRREQAEQVQRMGRLQDQAIAEDRRRAMAQMLEEQALVSLQTRAQAEDTRRLREQIRFLAQESRQLASGDRLAAFSKSELRDELNKLSRSYTRAISTNRVAQEEMRDLYIEVDRLHPELAKLNRRVGTFGDNMGRAFGRGSRVNFLNTIGSMVRGIIRLPVSIGKTITGLQDMYKEFGAFGATARLVTGGVARITAGLTVMTGLSSVISLAAGAVTALASSLAMGLVGAVGVAAGAFVPLIAGIGVATLAFQNMDKDSKAALRSIKDEVKGLGDVAAESMFADLPDQVDKLKGVMGDLEPVVRGIGSGLSDVVDYWLKLLDSEGFDAFRDDLETFLTGTKDNEGAVEALGKAVGDLAGGLGGLFRGVLPQTEEFLDWLRTTAQDFNEWANSASGQNTIRDFFADAADSAAELGGLIAAAGDLLGTLMRQGNDAGDSIIGSLTDSIRKLDGWLETAEGRRAFRQWARDGADFARAVGDIIVQVGKLGAALDNEFSRGFITGALKTLSTAIEGITAPLRTLGNLLGTGGDDMVNYAGQAAGVAAALSVVGGRVNRVKTRFGGLMGNLRDSEKRMGSVKKGAAGLAGAAGLLALSQSAGETSEGMKYLGGAATGALLGFSVGGPIGAAVGGGAGLIAAMADEVYGAGDAMKESISPSEQYAKSLDGVGDAAQGTMRALAAQNLQQDGVLKSARALGISTRDLVGAVTGEKDAMRRVQGALKDVTKWTREQAAAGKLSSREATELDKNYMAVKSALLGMLPEYRKHKREQEELAEATQNWNKALKGIPKKAHTDIKALGAEPAIKDVQKLAREYDLTPKQVKTTLDAVGIEVSRRQARSLVTDYKDIPDKVETRLDNINWDATAGEIAALRREYDLTPKQVSTLVRATGLRETDKGVRETTRKIMELSRKKAEPSANFITRLFDKAAKGVLDDIKNIDRQKPTPRADLDAKAFDTAIKRAVEDINIFDKEKPTPKADLDPSPFNGVLGRLHDNIRDLANEKPTPNARLDDSSARNSINDLFGKLGDLGREVARPGVEVSSSGAIRELDEIQDKLNGLMDKTITVTTEHVVTGSGRVPRTAIGGIYAGAQPRLIGESGPEAVVPLNRPLSQVDPAVRLLSAFAQGKLEGMGSGGTVGTTGRTYNVEQHIYSPSEDPQAVAAATINHLVAVGY